MYYTEESKNSVINGSDIVEIIGEFISLKKKGANWIGFSPSNNEKTPSFTVSPAKNIFKDFSTGIGGNVISYLMKIENMTFPEALEYCSKKSNIPLEFDKNVDIESLKKTKLEADELHDVVNNAVLFYRTSYNKLSDDHLAKKEAKKRKWTDEDLKKWNIGYCPDGALFLNKCFASQTFELAKKANIVYDKKDVFAGRLVFPLFVNNKPVGMAGRLLKLKSKLPKYINPSDTIIYKKDEYLYGLDEAKNEIVKENSVFIVEGYTDVIAMHKMGLKNTVSTNFSDITKTQLSILKRLCNKIIILFDNDSDKVKNTGLLSTVKVLQKITKEGFQAEVVRLDNGDDPDSFMRRSSSEEKDLLDHGQQIKDLTVDGILWYTEQLMNKCGTTTEMIQAIKVLTKILADVSDEMTRETYIKEVAKAVKSSVHTIRSEVNRVIEKNKQDAYLKTLAKVDMKVSDYDLPIKLINKGLRWEDVKSDVLMYGLFFFKNELWVARKNKTAMGDDTYKYQFSNVSNFYIKIIQHMNDDKFPTKLVEIVNKYGKKSVFDTRSEDFTALGPFKKMVENFGNYNFEGNDSNYSRLKAKLMNDMGEGSMIEILGWQNEGFWLFNNCIIMDDQITYLDENGCFKIKDTTYYVPSGNKLYENNDFKYISQKDMTYIEPDVSIDEWMKLLIEVHRTHAYNALLFTFASVFQDTIVKQMKFFPIMFLYGVGSSGKDQLISACQSFSSKQEGKISLMGTASTIKGKIRLLASFRNLIVNLSEYRANNADVNGWIKELWDRVGYIRGNITSHVGTDNIPMLSSLMITGNYYPNENALVQRLIVEEMHKNKFTKKDGDNYMKLKRLILNGYSGYIKILLTKRESFEANFAETVKICKEDITEATKNLSVTGRMIENSSVLAATYKLLEDVVKFPFSYMQWLEVMREGYVKQCQKLDIDSVTSLWWEAFGQALIDPKDGLVRGDNYKNSDTELIVNWKTCYPKVSQIYSRINKKLPPSKSVMLDFLKRDAGYVSYTNSYKYSTYRRTSGFIFNIERIGIQEYLSVKNHE